MGEISLEAHSSDEAFGEAALLRALRPAGEAPPNLPEATVRQQALIKKAVEDWAKEPPRKDSPPLAYWRDVARRGVGNPFLLQLARNVFAIPPSNASLERAFSHAGRAVNPKRASLDAQRGADTIFLHENYLRGEM